MSEEAELPKIEGYTPIRSLGEGDSSTVFLAKDEKNDREVAIKWLGTNADRRQVRRFAQEADIGKLVDHADINTVYDAGTNDEGAYIVMEFVDGYELADLMIDDTFNLEDRLQVMSRAALALHAAHQKDIIHRDIKPTNIFVTKDGNIRVLDFGIAKVQKRQLTQAGGFVGTPGYVSPEQSQGKPLDARADVFSLGLLTYELLTGDYPWSEDDTSALLIARATKEPNPFKDKYPFDKFDIPDEACDALHKIIHKSIEADPDKRYASCLEFATEIQRFLSRTEEGEEIATKKVTLPDMQPDAAAWTKLKIQWALEHGEAGPKQPPPPPEPTPTGPEDPSTKYLTWLVIAGAVIGTIIVIYEIIFG